MLFKAVFAHLYDVRARPKLHNIMPFKLCITFEQHVSGCSLSKFRDDPSTCKKGTASTSGKTADYRCVCAKWVSTEMCMMETNVFLLYKHTHRKRVPAVSTNTHATAQCMTLHNLRTLTWPCPWQPAAIASTAGRCLCARYHGRRSHSRPCTPSTGDPHCSTCIIQGAKWVTQRDRTSLYRWDMVGLQRLPAHPREM